MSYTNGNLYKHGTESGLISSNPGKLSGLVINSHTNGTIAIIDGTESSATVATSTLTSSGACAPATHAVTELVSSGAMVAGTHAVSVLTGDAVVATNVVVIGTKTYTARTFLVDGGAANDVAIGGSTENFLANLVKAINGTGIEGINYGRGTVAHTQVVAVTSDATTMTVRGRVPGTSLNTVATTGTALRTVWADTTLGGGTGASDAGVTTGAATFTIDTTTYTIVDELSENYGAAAVANQIKKGANEAAMLDNIKLAINGTGTAGTHYSTGTTAHPKVVATTNTDTVQTFRARVPGTSYNAIATTETMANTAFADTTLGGGTGNSDAGVTTDNALITIGTRTYTAVVELSESLGAAAIADQIKWVTNEATFLDNVKKAINSTGIAGTDYSTGTTINTQVVATTNSNTQQVIDTLLLGSAGNSIATTTTLANYAWTGATMTSGTGAIGRVMHNTITASAVATTGERTIDFYGENFQYGLSVVIGGTMDYTIAYRDNA